MTEDEFLSTNRLLFGNLEQIPVVLEQVLYLLPVLVVGSTVTDVRTDGIPAVMVSQKQGDSVRILLLEFQYLLEPVQGRCLTDDIRLHQGHSV